MIIEQEYKTGKYATWDFSNDAGLQYNKTTLAYETYATANYHDRYWIKATERGTASGIYEVAVPAVVAAGDFKARFRVGVEGAEAETDTVVATQRHYALDDVGVQAAAAAALGVFDGNFLSAAQKLQLTSAAKAENVDTLTKAAGAGDLAIVKTTVETIEALTGGAVADDRVKTIKCQDTTGSSIVGALVYSSSDALMRALIRGPFTSNAQGIATCLFPLGHQYIWIVATGYDIDNPLEITVT
jgi:hypothetical protein